MPPKSANTANSGIRQLATGESVIPSSTRADGSVRKEIKVKPGYKPPEDVELYKNRTAEAWKNRGKAGVPGAEKVQVGGEQASANKNAKRREARKKAAAAGAGSDETSKSANGDVKPEGKTNGASEAQPPVDTEAEAAKEARKLAKKLRQAKELKDKNQQGGDLLPEQFAKVTKIQELIRQLDALGFDTEGEKKDGDASAAGTAQKQGAEKSAG
ncbi:hypothetical protein KC331_g15293 [Hortaea werneckii]|uniref:WIBG Mago-binding domain-containing protein n=1 Tax=Hortaea werneckii TaxID=91943 RepID=A0A3M7BJ47_HORWE|nr:hypothetical protein KC331_g15293 [Hortaea werneckii]KAI7701007.1 hypothetical protein KC353_g15564 [Hortaea werneckii]RMY39716.1 hypothetical protein D0865_12747 [Hortaea werneckii]